MASSPTHSRYGTCKTLAAGCVTIWRRRLNTRRPPLPAHPGLLLSPLDGTTTTLLRCASIFAVVGGGGPKEGRVESDIQGSKEGCTHLVRLTGKRMLLSSFLLCWNRKQQPPPLQPLMSPEKGICSYGGDESEDISGR